MWKQCGQVARAFYHPKRLLMPLGLYLMVTLPSEFDVSSGPFLTMREIAGLFPPPLVVMFLGIFLGAYLKQQFANPRARLIPGFAAPHLLVSMLFFVAVLAFSVLPMLRNPAMSLAGRSAISLHVGMVGLWAGCRASNAATVVALLTFILPTTAVGRGLVDGIATGAAPILVFSLISAHVASLILLLRHLVEMNEDDPVYAKAQSLDAWNMGRATTQRNFQRDAAMRGNWMLPAQLASAAKRLERVTAVPARTPRQRVALFGLGDNYPSPFLMGMSVYALMEVVVLLLVGLDSIRSTRIFRTALSVPMILSFGWVLVPWTVWLQRWPRLGYESLRPVSRHDWVWENGAAIAKALVRIQVVWALMHVLIVAVLLPKFLTEPLLWEALIKSLGLQVLLFGVSAWLASYGMLTMLMGMVMVMGMGMEIMGGMGTVIEMVIGQPFGVQHPPWESLQLGSGIPLTLCLSVGMSLLGFVICRFAFRRWCQMDLP